MWYYKSPEGKLPAINDIELILGTKDADGHSVSVKDIRDKESSYSLDTNGFMIAKHPIPLDYLTHQDRIRSIYYPAMAELIRQRHVSSSDPKSLYGN